jgi:predicted DNA-binding transcriptional regulator YafY
MNRIDRLAAILIQLQTKRVVKAEEIAGRFEISLRTVYRDVKALMEAGVPIGSEAGKGYFIVEGYHLPPVMFTQGEASALMLAAKLVEKMTDRSVRDEFNSALTKIRAVLNDREKDHLENLQSHIVVWPGPSYNGVSDHFLNEIQQAVVSRDILRMTYMSGYSDEVTERDVEPIGLFYYGAAWHLIAWCNLRNGYRDFRADRIRTLKSTGRKSGEPNLMTLREYLDSIEQSNREMNKVTVSFTKEAARYVGSARYSYGFVSEEIVDDRVRMIFLTSYPRGLARWLLMFGSMVNIESPDDIVEKMQELTEELMEHYKCIPTHDVP